MLRRTEGHNNFFCSKERFENLSKEAGNIEKNCVRETISCLQLEAEWGCKQNITFSRKSYSKNPNKPINGCFDFVVNGGGGRFTYLEVKQPVSHPKYGWEELAGNLSSSIRSQVSRWVSEDFRSNIENLDLYAKYPTEEQVLILVDLFDVKNIHEKQLMERKIKLDLSDLKSSLVFINNKENI